jgi:hypothetical protein
MFKQKKSLLNAALLLSLTACGGGGDGGGSSPGSNVTSVSGKVVDGYLNGATVYCDSNKNGILDASEVSTTTDTGGNFRFPAGCANTIVGHSGSDVTTGYAFNGTLKAPGGSIVVTPLTTLLADTGMTTAQLAFALGLPAGTDVTQLDPADGQHPALLKTTLAVQQVVQQLANTFARLGGTTDVAIVYSQVSAALAKSFMSNPPGAPLIGADGTVNLAVVNQAASVALVALKADTRFTSINIGAADLAAVVALITSQAQLFVSALEEDLAALIKQLQNPAVPPIDTQGTVNYLALQNDSVKINGNQISYASLSGGATVSALSTVGLSFIVKGSPVIDTTISLALELVEVGGQNRVLQILLDKVNVKNTNGTLSIGSAAGMKIYVYGHASDSIDVNLTLNDLKFNPVSSINNSLLFNYQSTVDKVLTNVDGVSKSTAAKFTNITGTFQIKVAAAGLSVRNLDGVAALPTTKILVTNSTQLVNGSGIAGTLTIQ